MKYISVCSGIEAASVAWQPLGWEAVAFSEIEPFPCQVLKHHYPDVPNLGDISKVDWGKYHGAVDLVVGGTPCQSFSVAGKGEGLDGASGLVREYFRLLSECKPRWFVWENVPGVVSSNGGNDWLFILREWNKLGYHVGYRVLNAEYFGVPQRRRRIFAVGYFGNWRYPAKVLFEQYCLQRHSAPSGKKGEGYSRSSKAGAYTASGFARYKLGCGTLRATGGDFGGGSETLIAKCLTSKNTRLNVQDETLIPVKVFSIAGNTINRQIQNGGNGAGFLEGLSYTLNTIDRHAVAECYSIDSLASNSMKSPNPNSGFHATDVAKTLDTSDQNPSKNQGGMLVCGTLNASGAGTSRPAGQGNERVETEVLDAKRLGVRRLTPTECERLQGFPDGWTDISFKGKPAPDGARYKALGNSMAVPVMQWIGKRIQMVEEGKL